VTSLAVVLLTLSSSSNTVSASSSPDSPENFTIVVLPDTQFYSQSYPWIFENQTEWIVKNENAQNIVFVTHLGDIVDTYTDNIQWQNADNAMSILDNKVPYTVLPGNHDMFGNSSAPIYENYFPPSRYENYSYWGGSFDPSSANSSSPNMNNYQLFSWGGMNFITLSLQYEPPADVLSWADNVLNNYSNRRAIISTHSYLNPGGSLTDTGGSEIYDRVVVPENNVFLVLCGHMTESWTRVDNLGGRLVYQLLSDYQDLSNGGNGYLRTMEFVPSENKIYVKTYSPYLDNYMTDSANQFELSYSWELFAPSLISPKNNEELVDNTPTFEWTSVSNPGGVTYQIQITDNVDFSSPIYFASGLAENTHILPDENALALGMYFWRVRAVDNAGNFGLWSSAKTLFICTEYRWTQADWNGGPTKPSLQAKNWDNTYDNFYDNDNVYWSGSVRLENYLTLIPSVANHLVISEFASRGPGGAADEFVELYNPTDNSVSIAGWDLQYFSPGTGWTTVLLTYPSGATIPAYSFYLAANPNGYSPPGSGPAADYYTIFSLADGSTTSPRGVRLRDTSDVVIDTVVWGGDGNYARSEAEGGRTAPGAAVSPQSVERKARNISTAASMAVGDTDENSGNGYDSDNNYNDWIRQDFRNPQNSSSTLEYPTTSQFRSAGWFESSIFDAQSSADWKFIGWIENKPDKTNIVVKARTGGDDNPYDGGWSDWYLHNNGTENAMMENERYIQYRVELSTTDDTKTPELLRITLNYETVPAIVMGVSISISPGSQIGKPEMTLTYTVTIKNLETENDNYSLTIIDNARWGSSLLENRFENVRPGENRQTTLSVTIPSEAIVGIDNITVIATSQADNTVSDNTSCTAIVVMSAGIASIRLATGSPPSPAFLWGIRKVRVTADLTIYQGDNLHLIFLAADNKTVENEDIIWSRTAPGAQTVTLTNLIVPHDIAFLVNVHRVKLVLTDSAGNVILDNMAWYKVVQDDWGSRVSWIVLNWASHNSSQQDQLGSEISTIILNWASTPTTRDQHDFSQS
jgi:hypothetical protein